MVWYYQLLLIVLVFLFLVILKKLLPKKLRRKMRISSLMIIPVLYCIFMTSLTKLELSVIPFLFFGLGLLGIMMTLVYAYVEGEIIYRVFFKSYFRFCALAVYGVFVLLFILSI
ncbi:DUF3397 family protein [Liquorilactobacillus mali]|uniref:DUF3397 family protein n=1 Tax=Liquorilactobacillus mali TaxID=1618 RepID=UPI002955DF8C|nr:DUF3397 family protein [Liquorilactobacillus mali]MDV7757158.1 DUF3397 family protein [Liquorilactobacillus mali]